MFTLWLPPFCRDPLPFPSAFLPILTKQFFDSISPIQILSQLQPSPHILFEPKNTHKLPIIPSKMHQMTTQICWRPMAPILVLLSSFLLLWPLEGIRAEMRMSPELDGMRKELNELRSRVQELMAAQNSIEMDEGNSEEMFNNKRAMLPYSGGIYGKRAAAMLPYSGGIYGKRSNNNGGSHLVAAEPSFILSRPNRAVPFNGGIFGR